jgi:hypothetical protein
MYIMVNQIKMRETFLFFDFDGGGFGETRACVVSKKIKLTATLRRSNDLQHLT